jgi:hypothetical protein
MTYYGACSWRGDIQAGVEFISIPGDADIFNNKCRFVPENGLDIAVRPHRIGPNGKPRQRVSRPLDAELTMADMAFLS